MQMLLSLYILRPELCPLAPPNTMLLITKRAGQLCEDIGLVKGGTTAGLQYWKSPTELDGVYIMVMAGSREACKP